MAEAALTPASVERFLHEFEALAGQHDFDLVADRIADDAIFRFNDGDFIGRPAIRAAFEKTWRGSPGVQQDRFRISDIHVLAVDAGSAAATYDWHWEGRVGEQAFAIHGRGTRVLALRGGRLQIVHEHLSRMPAA